MPKLYKTKTLNPAFYPRQKFQINQLKLLLGPRKPDANIYRYYGLKILTYIQNIHFFLSKVNLSHTFTSVSGFTYSTTCPLPTYAVSKHKTDNIHTMSDHWRWKPLLNHKFAPSLKVIDIILAFFLRNQSD